MEPETAEQQRTLARATDVAKNGRLYEGDRMDEGGNRPHRRGNFYWERP